MPRHKPTDPDNVLLISQQQFMVGARLLEGMTITDAASEAGIGRQQVHEWLARDPKFQRWLNVNRIGLWRVHRRRLEALAGAAIDVIAQQLAAGNVDSAWRLLAAGGLLQASPPDVGPLTAMDVFLADGDSTIGLGAGLADDRETDELLAALEAAHQQRVLDALPEAVAHLKARKAADANGSAP
jgi:hypothetical protein